MVTGGCSHVMDNEGEKREPRALGKNHPHAMKAPWRWFHPCQQWLCVRGAATLRLQSLKAKSSPSTSKFAWSLTDRVQALEHNNKQAPCRDARGARCWMEFAFLALISWGEKQGCKPHVLNHNAGTPPSHLGVSSPLKPSHSVCDTLSILK